MKPSGDIPECESLRRDVHDLFMASLGRGQGPPLLALASWFLQCPQLWERLLVLPPLSEVLGLSFSDLGSSGNDLSPNGDSEVIPQPVFNLPRSQGHGGPGLLLTGWP